jgi:gamma-glutamyltranspeptidase/glutathione hydrolase
MPETPVFSSAAVAAPHLLAAATGQSILAAGGNAIEAMVAMAATVAVVYPHMNGIGGDGFWLIREPGGRMHAIEACGPAGALATIKRYRDKGYDAVPPRGPDATVTVAGAIGGWQIAQEMAHAFGGNLPLDMLLSDAVRHAREGCPVSASEARYAVKEVQALHASPGFAGTFLDEMKTPAAGASRRMPVLADTFAQLSHAGLGDFYRGDIGREIAADLERIGSPVSRRDVETYQARLVHPLAVRLKDATVYNLPPPSQGLASLLMLGMVERLGTAKAESVEHQHGLIEAAKRAFAIRDRVVTDPAFATEDPADYLTGASLDREAAAIDMRRAAPFPLPKPADGDTIWMGAIDGNGLAVSYIQSLFWEFGSGCVLPGTGILWSNRGLAFSLDPAAMNPLEPGRRPYHTLNPALAVFDDGRVLAYGTMGGEGQPQIQAQIFARYATFGMGLADSVDAPRWLLGRSWRAPAPTLKVEDRFDSGLLRALAHLGHDVEEIGKPYADGLGHAGMVVRHARNGRVEATHDPRSDGGALGL